MLLPPQPTKSKWAYTSAASCSVCCTKAGSIQRTSYKRGESSKLYRKGRLEPRHALATLQRREAYSSHFHTQLHASRLWTAFGRTAPRILWVGVVPRCHVTTPTPFPTRFRTAYARAYTCTYVRIRSRRRDAIETRLGGSVT